MSPHELPAIVGWARSPVAPVGGALKALAPHALATPVLHSLLAQCGLPPEAVDAIVLGNALGAGGNPARMLGLAAGLPEHCAAHSIDTQCCSGLDAVALAVGLLQSGQAGVVIAGGVEAWSRAPLRQTRPLHAGELPRSYERPAFAPDPQRDPDMLQSAADYALAQRYTRAAQEAYAIQSHQRAVDASAQLADEITPVAGLDQDAYPRPITAARAARMPALAQAAMHDGSALPADYALHALTVSAKADGAALVLLATPQACQRWGLRPSVRWLASASRGHAPETPLLAAAVAAQAALAQAVLRLPGQNTSAGLGSTGMQAIELHDAFAVQGLAFCDSLGLSPEDINRRGGGLARGHPIAASGAVALVRVLAELQQLAQARKAGSAHSDLRGLAAIAGAGGIGAACVVQWL